MGNSWAKKVAEAQAAGGGGFIDAHGRYTFAVQEVISRADADRGFKGDSIIFKMRVMESAKKSPSDVGEPHGVGDVRNVVFNFTKDTMAASKCKALLLAIVGKKEKEVTADEIQALSDAVVAPEQPIMGKLVKGETFEFTIKSGANAGKKGVGVNWSFVLQTPEELAASRAAIMGG